MIPVNTIIKYIETKLGKFPHERLMASGNTGILAGGSVANAILSIVENKAYPINDLDVFVQADLVNVAKTSGKEIVKAVNVTLRGYPVLFSNNLYMIHREEEDEVIDVVTMQGSKIIDPGTFPKAVLSSFDLNCVQAGIFWNGKEYELETTHEFLDFINTKQIYCVNVHSRVTIARLLKKAADLEGYVNMNLELSLMANACNVKDLKPLIPEQEQKHSNILEEVNTHIRKLEKHEKLYYELWLNTKFQSVRQSKIRVLRSILDDRNKKYVRDAMLYILSTDVHLAWLSNFYDGSISEWIDRPIPVDKLDSLNSFIFEHPTLQSILRSCTIPEMIKRQLVIEKYQRDYSVAIIGDLETVISVSDFYKETNNIEDGKYITEAIKTGDIHYLMGQAVESFEKRQKELSRNLFEDSGKQLPILVYNDCSIKELVTALELEEQGVKQHHCVGGYADKVKNGGSRILSVYNTVTQELSTCEISYDITYSFYSERISKDTPKQFKVLQHRGIQNRDPSKEAKDAVRQYVLYINNMEDVADYLKPKKTIYIFEPF